jgi:hypothetical protein
MPGVRFTYKNYPNTTDPDDWLAVLNVQISNSAKHSPPSRKFEAVIDSGASICLFHSSVGEGIGLNIEKGERQETIGVSGAPTAIYRHTIHLHFLGNMFKIRAGFLAELPFGGLLGRIGFFEHFKITFDGSTNPPGFDLERVYRA